MRLPFPFPSLLGPLPFEALPRSVWSQCVALAWHALGKIKPISNPFLTPARGQDQILWVCVAGAGSAEPLLFPSGFARHGSSPNPACAPGGPVSPPSWELLWVLGGGSMGALTPAGLGVVSTSPGKAMCAELQSLDPLWPSHWPWLEPAILNRPELPHPGWPSPRADFPLPMAAFPGERRGTCVVPVQGAAAGPAEGLAWTRKAVHAARAGHWPEVNGSFVFPEKYEGLYSVELTWSPTSHCAVDV